MFVLPFSVLLIFCTALCFGIWPKFLVLNGGEDIRLIESHSVGSNNTPNYTVLVDRLQYCMSMDAAIEDKLIFYVNNKDELTMLPVERPQDSQVLVRKIFLSPESLSVDWITRKFYWSETDTNRIEVLSYDKPPYLRKVLIYENLSGVRGLFVDPIHGYIFYNNYEDGHTMERAWMDGSHRETIITLEHGMPNVLTVDYADGKIYWTDGSSREINSAKLDGTDRRLVVGMLETPYSLVVYDSFLFWSDLKKPGIFWCKKYFCDKPQKLLNEVNPYVLRVYNKTRQLKRENPCGVNNGGCSHLCLLIPQAPYKTCACPTGIRLLDDNVSCSDGPSSILLVARRTDLRMISLDTPDFTDTIIRVKNAKDAVALDYDPIDGFAYWSDNDMKEIRRIRLNGSDEQTVIVSEMERCDGLAVDWIARNLYWTDSGTDRIEVARLDGMARRVLVWQDIAAPRAIVLDPPGGYMYWSDWDERIPKIEKSFLDGTNRTLLVKFDANGKHWPNGLALDVSKRFLYYADAKSDEIWRISVVDGLHRSLIISQDLHHVFGLSILGEYIYWSDWQRRSLGRANKINGTSKLTLHENLADLMGIKAVNLTYKPTEMNDCGVRNGGCSHLCLFRPIPLGKICVCPVGFELSTDRRTCVVPEAFLIYTQVDTRDIMRISLSNFPPNLDRLRLHNVSKPLAMDYNFVQNKIYWAGTEGSNGIISSAYLNGSQMTTLIDTGTFYVEGLAVDWVAENLYWSDSHYGQIEVSRLTGRSRRVIVWQDAFPRTLVVHPNAGYLYWADWNLHRYTIQRSELSGNERVTFLSDVGRVMSMTIDYEGGKLYLASNGEMNELNAVYVADLNVGSRQVLVREIKMNPYAITFFADHLYWADYDKQSIEVGNKFTGQNRTTLHSNLPFLINLMAVHPSKQQGWNPCATKIKNCDHLCFYSPSVADRNKHESAKCACPTHYTLETNGLNCRPPASFVLFAQNTTIQRIKMKDISDQNDYPVIILPFLSSYIYSMDYDPINRTILWLTSSISDKDERKFDFVLHRAKEEDKNFITENNLKFATSDFVKPFNLTYDPYSRTIFWINEATNSINASRLFDDGHLIIKHLGAIVRDSDYRPRILSIDSKRRSLFFANDASSGSIVHCKLDGRDCKTLIYEVGRVQALAVDHERGTLFWADSNSGSIKKIDPDGRNRLTVELKSNVWPISMAIFRDRLFFVDSNSKLVESIDKNVGGEIRKEFNQPLIALSKLLAVDEHISQDIAKSPCRTSTCSHLCLLQKNATSPLFECACPLAMAWSVPEKTCVDLKLCKKSEWRCATGLQCIDRFNLCNGKHDCFDKSDELNELCKSCRNTDFFPCESNRTCIHRSKYCDSRNDCPDRSDELCQCPENFDCKNMMGHDFPIYCIRKDLMCDGVDDCDGGVDEKHCSNNGRNWYGRSTDGAVSSTTPHDNATVNIVIVLSIIIIGFAVLCVIFVIFKCTRNKRQHVLFNVVNQQGSSVDGQTITTTVVEMEMSSHSRMVTPRSKATPRSIAVSSLFSQRPDLTGKSSSSSDYGANQPRYYESSGSNGDGRRRVPIHNPPPSPASSINGVEQRSTSAAAAARSSTRSKRRRRNSGSIQRNNRRRGGYNRHGQKVLYKDFRDPSDFRGPSPPPPYSPCSTDVNRSEYSEDQETLPSQCKASEPLISPPPKPPPPSPTSTDHSSYAGCSTKQNSSDKHHRKTQSQAPPPSPVSRKSYRTTSSNRIHYSNPPPSPNNVSGSSSSC